MNSIDNFLSEVYSEVMSASTADDSFAGYSEWSAAVEESIPEGNVENFAVVNGKVEYKGQNVKRGPFVNGIEV